MTIWHLKELSRGERTKIRRGEQKTICLPFYEGLTVEDLLTYAKQREDVMRALPAVQHEILKLPREYLGNVIVTIVGDHFQEWVDEQIRVRNAKYKEEHDQNLEVDSEVEAAYQRSTSIGSKYFTTHFFTQLYPYPYLVLMQRPQEKQHP